MFEKIKKILGNEVEPTKPELTEFTDLTDTLIDVMVEFTDLTDTLIDVMVEFTLLTLRTITKKREPP